jgi:hypothetical protein
VRDREHTDDDAPPADPAGIEEPHDVLAAEEFGIGTRDERHPPDPAGIEDPHDVPAAEEFAMPVRDDRHPPDPTGIPEPHDVLAAEEFAMPVPEGTRGGALAERDPRAWMPLVALALLALAILRRRR